MNPDAPTRDAGYGDSSISCSSAITSWSTRARHSRRPDSVRIGCGCSRRQQPPTTVPPTHCKSSSYSRSTGDRGQITRTAVVVHDGVIVTVGARPERTLYQEFREPGFAPAPARTRPQTSRTSSDGWQSGCSIRRVRFSGKVRRCSPRTPSSRRCATVASIIRSWPPSPVATVRRAVSPPTYSAAVISSRIRWEFWWKQACLPAPKIHCGVAAHSIGLQSRSFGSTTQ